MSNFFGGVFTSTVSVETPQDAEIPQPEGPRNFSTIDEPSTDTFVGGSFRILRPVNFDRVAIHLNSIPASQTALGRFLIYQQSDGLAGDAIPLVGSFDFSATQPPSAPKITSALNEGTIDLVQGICWALWGFRTGSSTFAVISHESTTGDLMNSDMISGTYPVTFTTNIDANTTPSTFNPIEGGGTVTGVVDNKQAIWRVFTA